MGWAVGLGGLAATGMGVMGSDHLSVTLLGCRGGPVGSGFLTAGSWGALLCPWGGLAETGGPHCDFWGLGGPTLTPLLP